MVHSLKEELFYLMILLASVSLVNAEMIVEKNISFLGQNRYEKLDIYHPDKMYLGPHPCILLIHGGGWRSGDKAEGRTVSIATTLAENGYTVFSINYLLNEGDRDAMNKLTLTKVAWPQSFYDCKTALRFIRMSAGKYNVDPQRIGVMGCSAGAHLGMMLAVTEDDVESNRHGMYKDQSNAVSCVVNFYGIPDLRGQRLTPFTGSEKTGEFSIEEAASPVTFIDRSSPPFYIAHGTEDSVIPVEASRLLAELLREEGVEHVFTEIEGAGHSFDLQPEQMDLRSLVIGFLKIHLGTPKYSECDRR